MNRCVTIRVTAEDIAKGNPGDFENCPIARAAERRLGCHVGVGGLHHVWLETPAGLIEAVGLPRSAQIFRSRFDRRRRVEPFEFCLEIPQSFPFSQGVGAADGHRPPLQPEAAP